jgi:dynamin 1-like protein
MLVGRERGRARAGAQTLRVPVSATEQEEVQVEVTRLLVEGYFGLVRASLQDAVPKAVMHFLVMRVQRGLQQHLIRTLYRRAPAGRARRLRSRAACTRPAMHERLIRVLLLRPPQA